MDGWREKISCREASLLAFSRNLGILLNSGIPIVTALDTITHYPDDPKFEKVVEDLSGSVAQGFTLSRAMARFPRCFLPIYCRMVEVGETSGTLSTSLEALTRWGEADRKTREHVRGALVYPTFVLAVTFILTILLVTFFVPQVLEGAGRPADLPLLSKALLTVAHLFGNGGFWLVVLGVAGLTIPTLKRFLGSEKGELLLRSIPVLGGVLQCAADSRYSLTLSTLLSHGVDLPRSLQLAGESCGSALVARDNKRILNGITHGESLAELYGARPDVYSMILRHMVRVGEETSHLSELIRFSSQILAEETEYLLDSLLAALEPMVMTIVAVIVGGILIAVFSSIYAQLGSF